MYITSFSQDGFKLYGEKFLLSFLAHSEEPITVYYEQTKPPLIDDRIIYKDLLDVPGCVPFLQATGKMPAFRGEIKGKRNYRYDVFRFCRKSFAQIDAAQQHEKLFWLDADVEISDKPVIPEFDGHFMLYLGRPQWHSCASFVGWDNSHADAEKFWSAYYELYLTGQVFLLPEWHDSYVLDVIRSAWQISAKNLAENIVEDGPFNVFDKVFPWGHHKKGNLKYGDSRKVG